MKETLTLNKKPKNVKKIFKSLLITEAGSRAIGISQSNFEIFWRSLNRIDCTSDEKYKCLDHLKEASSWYTRGIAKYNQKEEDIEIMS